MKIFLICSKRFYDKIPAIHKTLEVAGHLVTLPNCYDDPGTEDRYKALGLEEHSKWKAHMIEQSLGVIENNDAVLVLNFDKGEMKNYIGVIKILLDPMRIGHLKKISSGGNLYC